MTSITIQISPQEADRLDSLARAAGLPREKMIEVSLRDLLSAPDENFEAMAKEIVFRNRDLYRSLA